MQNQSSSYVLCRLLWFECLLRCHAVVSHFVLLHPFFHIILSLSSDHIALSFYCNCIYFLNAIAQGIYTGNHISSLTKCFFMKIGCHGNLCYILVRERDAQQKRKAYLINV